MQIIGLHPQVNLKSVLWHLWKNKINHLIFSFNIDTVIQVEVKDFISFIIKYKIVFLSLKGILEIKDWGYKYELKCKDAFVILN